MAVDIDTQLPSPLPRSPGPSSPLLSANLRYTIYIPSKTGRLPEPLGSSLVTLINNAFRRFCDVPGGLGMFPQGRARLMGGIDELHCEIGKGWLVVWTLDGVAVGTTTIRTMGRGWARVPMWEEAHPGLSLKIPIDFSNNVLTERAATLFRQLEQDSGTIVLYELSMVAVDPALTGSGIGSAMLHDVEEFVSALDVSQGNFWVAGEEKAGSPERKVLVVFVIDKSGNETWYGKRGYEHVATAHRECGFWDCKVEQGFDLLTLFKEIHDATYSRCVERATL